MGNNNYQFRLQSLEVLDQYSNKLKFIFSLPNEKNSFIHSNISKF